MKPKPKMLAYPLRVVRKKNGKVEWRDDDPKMLAPCECRNQADVLKLKSNFVRLDGVKYMMTEDAYVRIEIEHRFVWIYKHDLNRFIRWWQRKQRVRKG